MDSRVRSKRCQSVSTESAKWWEPRRTPSKQLSEMLCNGLDPSIVNVDWFEVEQVRGYVRNNDVDHFQVTVKVGYRLEDA